MRLLTVVTGAQKTEVDVPSDGGSEVDKEKMAAAEKIQSDAIKEFKQKKKDRELQEQLRKQYSKCGVIL